MIIHTVGIIGLNSSFKDLFLVLTPLNLLISVAFIYINQKEYNQSLLAASMLIYLMGFIVELIGVKTGVLFGEYNYGNTLGLKLFNIPLIIGVNWLMLVFFFFCACICNSANISFILKSILGAFMLVLLDFLIEPIAIKFDFWTWQNGIVPFKNYVAWFLFSFLFLMIFYKFQFNKNNSIAKLLYFVQILFFGVLTII
ncbi:MAG: carotenoid biosynthesis protein [Bacteroidetes bacterium]|nr:carotenoid biosynthesis protein [Bacteroidota bacterium]